MYESVFPYRPIIKLKNRNTIYYRKDGNKLGRRKNSIIHFLMEDLLFNYQIHKTIHTPLVYINK